MNNQFRATTRFIGLMLVLGGASGAPEGLADSTPIPDALHCVAEPCVAGWPTCGSEAYGNQMTIEQLGAGTPVLRYDGRTDLAGVDGSIRDKFLFINLPNIDIEFGSEKSQFSFKRVDLESFMSGKTPSLPGTYQRSIDVLQERALLKVDCTSTLPPPLPPTPPMPIGVLQASCVGCHGPNGVSPMPGVPNIGAQSVSHLIDALTDYKIGARNDSAMGVMNGVSQSLGPEDIQAIAAFYASMTPPSQAGRAAKPEPTASLKSCCSCHSANGTLASGPFGGVFLTSQSEDYLATQLADFTSGVRANLLMRYIVPQYSSADLASFAAYFSASPSATACTDLPPDPQ